jgi:hypothetical protein
MAVETLKAYEERYHPKDDHDTKSVQGRMNAARANDESSSNKLNWLKAKEQVRVESTFASSQSNTDFQPIKPEQTTTVKFLLHKSLLDHSPTIVQRKHADWTSSLLV